MWSHLGDFIATTTQSHSALRYCGLTNGVLPTTDNYETLRPVIGGGQQVWYDSNDSHVYVPLCSFLFYDSSLFPCLSLPLFYAYQGFHAPLPCPSMLMHLSHVPYRLCTLCWFPIMLLTYTFIG